MIFSILSLFPDLVTSNIKSSITGRALDKGLFSFFAHDIRDFAINDYGKVDDSLYGGGKGMLMMCEPIYRAWQAALEDPHKACFEQPGNGEAFFKQSCSWLVGPSYREAEGPAYRKGAPSGAGELHRRTIYLSPKGRSFNQDMACELAQADQLIFLCGHYEGVDQRVLSVIEAEEVSLGDFVITGGELAAAVIVDAIARLLPGVLPASEAYEQESHYRGSLECRQYTKPACWRGLNVPAVLQSGHHANIEQWRRLDGWRETYYKRPDLFAKLGLTAEEGTALATFLAEEGEFAID